MNSRFWLSLISRACYVLSWVGLFGTMIKGVFGWMDWNKLYRATGLASMEWKGFQEFLWHSLFGVVAFAVLMIISGLLRLALDAHASRA
jgi:hypothetical protein